jgi:hypothetical protein
VLLALGVIACTPALNWREVNLGQLTTLMPCKPDTATRPVALAGMQLNLEVAGCEADHVLFAISRLQARDAAQAPSLMAVLRQASLAQIQVQAVHPAAGSGDEQTSFDMQADGRRPDGTALQARLKWLLHGSEVYQIAAYATQLLPEQTQNLVSEVRLR